MFRGGRAVALIDFDLAGPGGAAWDFAAAARSWVPLLDDADVTDSRRGRALERFRILLAGERAAPGRPPARSPRRCVANHDWTYAIVTEAAAAGHQGFADHWRTDGRHRHPGPALVPAVSARPGSPPRDDPAGNRRVHRMITVAGEALIDLIVDLAGDVDPRFGGGLVQRHPRGRPAGASLRPLLGRVIPATGSGG